MRIEDTLSLDKSLAYLNESKIVSDFSILSEAMAVEFIDNTALFESAGLELVTEKFSLKSVWEAIKKAFAKIRDHIRKLIEKIKEFFKSKKVKALEKKCDDLEKKLKESEADKIKLHEDKDKAEKEADFWKSQAKEDARKVDVYKKKLDDGKVDLAQVNAKLAIVGSEIINNDYLYFDIYDYMKKGIDPQRLVRCSEFKDLIDLGSTFEGDPFSFEKRWEMWKEENAEDMNMFVPEIFGTNDLRHGGYSHVDVHYAIRKHINDAKRFTSLMDLAKHCKWLLHGYQVTAMNECVANYQKAIGSIEKNMQKYFNYDNNEFHRNTDENGNPIQLDPVLSAMKEFVQILDNNVRMFAVLSDYAGRAVGAASSAVIALEKCYGIDFKSDELKYV